MQSAYLVEQYGPWTVTPEQAEVLPPPDQIVITAVSGAQMRVGTRKRVEPFCQNPGPFVQYIAALPRQQYDRSLFAGAFHAFIQRFSDDTASCAEKLEHYLVFKPYLFDISGDTLLVSFDSGYHRTGYEETASHIRYEESYSESYHDGGDSVSKEWRLTASSADPAGRELLHGSPEERIRLPENRGYWIENGHLYLAEPWGMTGVFEFYYRLEVERGYDSYITTWEAGTDRTEDS